MRLFSSDSRNAFWPPYLRQTGRVTRDVIYLLARQSHFSTVKSTTGTSGDGGGGQRRVACLREICIISAPNNNTLPEFPRETGNSGTRFEYFARFGDKTTATGARAYESRARAAVVITTGR